jgi:isopenicillin-N N-acyltransferase like protein
MSRQLQVITLDGDGLTRGRQYGEQARPLINEALDRMEAQLAGGGRMFSDAVGVPVEASGVDRIEEVRRFLAETDFQRDIEAWVPDLLAETRGIAEGANVVFERVLAMQLLDEVWSYESARLAQLGEAPRACTSMAMVASPGKPALLAQNLDVATWMDGLQLVLKIQNPLTEVHSLVYTMAGMIGVNGLNSRGLGLGVNGLTQLRSGRRGLPVAFVVRALLAQPSLRAARRYITAIPHATGQHYLLASPEGIAGFECSAGSVASIESETLLVHTNHPLVNEDRLEPAAPDELDKADTGARLTLAERCLADREQWNVESLQRLLADRDVPLCRIPDGRVEDFTFGATVMELGSRPRMLATAGPPSREPFACIELD